MFGDIGKLNDSAALLQATQSNFKDVDFDFKLNHIDKIMNQDTSFAPLIDIPMISCQFSDNFVSQILHGSFDIQQTKATVSPHVIPQSFSGYSKILCAGYQNPLLAAERVTSFMDITLPDVVQITSGVQSILALTDQGFVYGRGKNTHGELALGDTNPKGTWTQIEGFSSPVRQIAMRGLYALFLTDDGRIYSTGDNKEGQLVSTMFDSCSIGYWKYDQSMYSSAHYEE